MIDAHCDLTSRLQEGSSQARHLMSRLIPSHKDTAAEQLQSVPQLATLSVPERQALCDKFVETDEPSFFQYLRALYGAAS